MSARLPVVGLHGAPRSGTTWIGQIFNSSAAVAYRYQPFFAYAFRARVDAAASAADLDAILDDIAETTDDFILQRAERRLSRAELSFPKTAPATTVYKEVRYHHLLPTLMEIGRFRGVGIVRDPIDVLASWVKAPREFDPAWDLAEEWRWAPRKNAGRVEEFYGYEGWKRCALLFEALAAQHPDRFRILSYERLVEDPAGEIAELFGFLGLTVTDQVREFLARSTSTDDQDPYGVFRSGERSGGADAVIPEIQRLILDDLRAAGLQRYAARRLSGC